MNQRSALVGIARVVVLIVALAGCSATPTATTKSVTLACPSKPLGVNAKKDPNLQAKLDASVPVPIAPTDATAALVCHYAGMNVAHVKPGTLLGATTVPDPQHFAQVLNRSTPMKTGPDGKVSILCPMDDGTRETILFSSPSQGEVRVNFPRNGCVFLTTSMARWVWQPSADASKEMTQLNKGYPAP